MNSDKKLYLYSGLAIALSVVAYVVITKKKKLDTDPASNVKPDVTTPTGDVISGEQAVLDPTLTDIIKLPLAQTKAKMLGKNIYAKVENINPRQTPYVNNGWLVNNGVGGRITQKDTLIGTVTDVVNDSGSLRNNSGAIYKWVKVNPSSEAVSQIKDDSNILLGGTKTKTFYVREDVIKLK
jgi:hypothetical protein